MYCKEARQKSHSIQANRIPLLPDSHVLSDVEVLDSLIWWASPMFLGIPLQRKSAAEGLNFGRIKSLSFYKKKDSAHLKLYVRTLYYSSDPIEYIEF